MDNNDFDAEDVLLQMEEAMEYLLTLEQVLEDNDFDIEIEEEYQLDLEENFGKMTRMQRVMAAKKAAMTKRRRGTFAGGRKKSPFKLLKIK